MTTETVTPPETAAGGVIVVPADRFFVTLVPLAPDVPAQGQVELALEETSPFPLAQLYYGFVIGPGRTHALAYSAYRRRFNAEETAGWADAEAVIPSFLGLLGQPPSEAIIAIHAADGLLTGMAWDGQTPLPLAVAARPVADPPTGADVDELAAELRAQAGLASATVRRQDGEIAIAGAAGEGAVFTIAGDETYRLDGRALAAADVREKVFLQERRRLENRDRWLWRGLVAVLIAFGVAALLELGALGLRAMATKERAGVEARAPQVRQVQTEQALATRVEDLSARRLRPFEMLAVASAPRPRSIQFLRATTQGQATLEIEAQTPSAADVGAYEATLRGLPGVERVITRDLRSREGLTTFIVAVAFRPDAWRAEGGRP